jgi:hypothetical protein
VRHGNEVLVKVVFHTGDRESSCSLPLSTVDIIKATSWTNDACPQASHLAKPIVLDFKEIKATDNQRLNDVKGFTEPSYEQWMLGPSGC